MQSPRPVQKIFLALCANAVVLVLILVALLSRDTHLSLSAAALGQSTTQPPIAGGNSLFVMPAQLSPNTWGCYLLDNDNHTLCVYQYSPGERLLRFAAARNFASDRLLSNFNTQPPPTEISDLVTRERQGIQATTPPPKSPETPKEQ